MYAFPDPLRIIVCCSGTYITGRHDIDPSSLNLSVGQNFEAFREVQDGPKFPVLKLPLKFEKIHKKIRCQFVVSGVCLLCSICPFVPCTDFIG